MDVTELCACFARLMSQDWKLWLLRSQHMHLALMRKWQQALKDADDWPAGLNFGTAQQRVVSLVLKMRNPVDGRTCNLFSRENMGSLLGLKLETVSRKISKLVRDGVISPMDNSGRIYAIFLPDVLLKESMA
jgi:CRP/FNR family transcriptional regulator